MGDSRTAAALGALLLLAGCSTVGDLGRPAPVSSFVSTKSAFNETDEEREMQNRIWRFLHAPHAEGWFGKRKAETASYYRWLTATDFRSSRTRYTAVGSDVQADLDTIPATFDAICDVREIDRRRTVAVNGIGGLEPELIDGVTERREANDSEIGRFVSALGFRYESYTYALEHLLVETPHEGAVVVDDQLSELATYVSKAERDEFCGSAVTLGPPLDLEPDQIPILPQTSSDSAAS